jgi:nucleotide-binding universal stress UspA family protein
MYKSIFVATDGSDSATKAVRIAAEMAAAFECTLTVGHVIHFGRSAKELARMAEVEHITERVSASAPLDFHMVMASGGDVYAGTRPTAEVLRAITLVGEEITARALEQAKEAGVTRIKTHTTSGDAADGILDMAQEAGADLVVVGHRGLGRVQSLLMGSVAHKVAQHADCAVLVCR